MKCCMLIIEMFLRFSDASNDLSAKGLIRYVMIFRLEMLVNQILYWLVVITGYVSVLWKKY